MSTVNHLTLFLTQPLPQPDMAASIYFLWPQQQQQQQGWHLLGVLSNEKPSAVFKISGLKPVSATALAQSKSDIWAHKTAAALALPSGSNSNTIAQVSPSFDLHLS